eukprot:TRINITY_DN2143_c0_g1_i6.p1 TRINITY_DN2143_c0_g1~~TRINITY_DN2143_c0_g1_i6.p1  ORF type:complete len:358 (-),score=92.45 TRINITY_DN2143_c0_g1_i6:1054-2127(-)
MTLSSALSLHSFNLDHCRSSTSDSLNTEGDNRYYPYGNSDNGDFDYAYSTDTVVSSAQLGGPRGGGHGGLSSDGATAGGTDSGHIECGGQGGAASWSPSAPNLASLGRTGIGTQQQALPTPKLAWTAPIMGQHSTSPFSSGRSTAGFPPAEQDAPQSGPAAAVVYRVKFKRSTQDYAPPTTAREAFVVGEYVVVEADRGENIGVIEAVLPAGECTALCCSEGGTNGTGPVTGGALDTEGKPCGARRGRRRSSFKLKKHAAADEAAAAAAGGGHEAAKSSDTTADADPDAPPVTLKPCILRRASQSEMGQLSAKAREEAVVLSASRRWIASSSLNMVCQDAEFQFDRHKLTIYFEADR